MINVLKPDYDEKTLQELAEVMRSGWVGQGPKCFEFEKAFAEYVGAKYCIMTNSGTSALDLCLKVYGIKDGELITTPMTFVSDAIVGEWNGMDVTFADIKEDDLCIDPKYIGNIMTENTKAIIAVDSHGRLADIKGIRDQIGYMNILNPSHHFDPLIIEDAAHACYTQGAGEHADITIWSFQAVKTLPIFDGGAITTNDEAIYKKLRTLTWLGVEKSTYERSTDKKYSWDYDITQSQGLKAYMTDVQAVIGLGQLRRLPLTQARRRTIQRRYNEAFKDLPGFKEPMYSDTVQYYTPQWERRDELSDFLAQSGIATSVHFKPLSEMTYWKKAVKNPLPVTNRVWPNLLSLPCYNSMTDMDISYVITQVKEFYK